MWHLLRAKKEEESTVQNIWPKENSVFSNHFTKKQTQEGDKFCPSYRGSTRTAPHNFLKVNQLPQQRPCLSPYNEQKKTVPRGMGQYQCVNR